MELNLTRQERDTLQARLRQQRGEARQHRRARTILLTAEGPSVSAIARALGTCRSRSGQWQQRFQEQRLSGLEDLPRSGRPPEVTPLERHQVIATACGAPADFGFQRILWDQATLAKAVISAGLVRAISPRAVGLILE